MTCVTTTLAAGPCATCGDYMHESHLSDGRIYCAEHCPVHGAEDREWGEFRKTEGEQCKTFIRRFDPAPRLQNFQRISHAIITYRE